jgi:hypothetical protein
MVFSCVKRSLMICCEQPLSEEQHSRLHVSTVQFRRVLVCIPTGGFQMGNSTVSWQIKTVKNTNSSNLGCILVRGKLNL